jgi:hypothetical protein
MLTGNAANRRADGVVLDFSNNRKKTWIHDTRMFHVMLFRAHIGVGLGLGVGGWVGGGFIWFPCTR